MPRPRLHLSTAIILALLAGALLYANMRPQLPPLPDRPKGITDEMYENMLMNRALNERPTYGWPAQAAEQEMNFREPMEESGFAEMYWDTQLRPQGIAINAAVALAILIAAAFLLERRARRKPGTPLSAP